MSQSSPICFKFICHCFRSINYTFIWTNTHVHVHILLINNCFNHAFFDRQNEITAIQQRKKEEKEKKKMNNAHVFLTKAIFNFGNIAYIFVHIVVIPLMVNSCLPFPIVSIEPLKVRIHYDTGQRNIVYNVGLRF